MQLIKIYTKWNSMELQLQPKTGLSLTWTNTKKKQKLEIIFLNTGL